MPYGLSGRALRRQTCGGHPSVGFQGGTAGKPRTIAVKFIHDLFHAVVSLGDRGGGKCVRLKDIGARHGIGVVNIFDSLWLRQDQQVVVALQVAGTIRKAIATKVIFVEAKAWICVPMAPSRISIRSFAALVKAAKTSEPSRGEPMGPNRLSTAIFITRYAS